MSRSTFHHGHIESQAADVLIPLIRAAATVGFAIAPCSLGFVIIAVSERLEPENLPEPEKVADWSRLALAIFDDEGERALGLDGWEDSDAYQLMLEGFTHPLAVARAYLAAATPAEATS